MQVMFEVIEEGGKRFAGEGWGREKGEAVAYCGQGEKPGDEGVGSGKGERRRDDLDSRNDGGKKDVRVLSNEVNKGIARRLFESFQKRILGWKGKQICLVDNDSAFSTNGLAG